MKRAWVAASASGCAGVHRLGGGWSRVDPPQTPLTPGVAGVHHRLPEIDIVEHDADTRAGCANPTPQPILRWNAT
jgi:hypothetical protein